MDKGILSRDFYSNEEYNYGTKYFDAEAYKNNDSNVSDAIDTTRLAKQTMIRSTNQRIQKANRSTTALEVAPFRLPTEAEWEYRSEEHTSELQSRGHLVCRLLLEQKKGT